MNRAEVDGSIAGVRVGHVPVRQEAAELTESVQIRAHDARAAGEARRHLSRGEIVRGLLVLILRNVRAAILAKVHATSGPLGLGRQRLDDVKSGRDRQEMDEADVLVADCRRQRSDTTASAPILTWSIRPKRWRSSRRSCSVTVGGKLPR